MSKVSIRFLGTVFIALLGLASFGLISCSENKPDDQVLEATAAAAAPEGSAINEEYGIAIEKCEFIAGSFDNPTIAITYSFENKRKTEVSFDNAVFPQVTQDGSELYLSTKYKGTQGSDAVPGAKAVAPGERVDVQKTYILSNEKDVDVECSVKDSSSSKIIVVANRTFAVKEAYNALKSQSKLQRPQQFNGGKEDNQ